MAKRNGYDLSRRWFDFAFENSNAKCYHTALFMWMIELNNRLGWKDEFGLPTQATMDGLSIGNKRTYISALNDLVTWKFVEIVKESKNQYSSMIVKICRSESDSAQVSALDSALSRHRSEQSSGTGLSIGSSTAPIDKPLNKETSKQETLNLETDIYSFQQYVSDVNTATGKKYKGDSKAERQFTARIKEGWRKSDIQTAIRNAVKSDYHIGNQFQYITPEFMSRADKLNAFSQMSGASVDPSQFPGYDKDLHNERRYSKELVSGEWVYKLKMMA